jgi:RNA recognition motif-containing protein
MTNKLFVAGLPYSVDDQQLSEHFSSMGTVTSATVITDRNTGRSKGFGFVEFGTEEEAKKAMELDGTDFGGRTLLVKEARPMEPRKEGFGGNRDRSGGGSGSGKRDFSRNDRDNRDRRGGNRW